MYPSRDIVMCVKTLPIVLHLGSSASFLRAGIVF
jgi:hypothetical protein